MKKQYTENWLAILKYQNWEYWVHFYIQNKMYMGTLSKQIASECRKRRNSVECTSHGDSTLYITYHNTIR